MLHLTYLNLSLGFKVFAQAFSRLLPHALLSFLLPYHMWPWYCLVLYKLDISQNHLGRWNSPHLTKTPPPNWPVAGPRSSFFIDD